MSKPPHPGWPYSHRWRCVCFRCGPCCKVTLQPSADVDGSGRWMAREILLPIWLLTHWVPRAAFSPGYRKVAKHDAHSGPQIYGAGDRRWYRARWGAAEQPSSGRSYRRVANAIQARERRGPPIAPHHDRIKDWLDADKYRATIIQRLRDDHGWRRRSRRQALIATHFAGEVPAKITVPRGPADAAVRADRLRGGWARGPPGHRAPGRGVGVRDGTGVL